MPLYEYQCESCQDRFEKIQKSYSDPPLETCPKCGKGPVRKLISSPAIQFKGTGWYITDYAKKSSSDGQTGGSTGASDKSEKSEKSDKSEKAEKTESKSDAKADAKSDASTSSSTPPAAKTSKRESS
jgi:putative FmdB family regulatory protein